jgi:hypothetical protein
MRATIILSTSTLRESALRILSAVTLLVTLLLSFAQAQGNRDWVLLGQQTVGFRVDRDVVAINQSEDWHRTRAFRAFVFQAERNDVFMMSIRIVYLNGFTEEVRVDRMIPQRGQLEVNLGGERSFMRQIEMIYRARPDFRGEALVRVFGVLARPIAPPPPPPPPVSNWQFLGQQTVGFQVDRDVVNINQSEDWYRTRTFRALMFQAERNDVFMMSIRIVYLNGFTEDLQVDRIVPQNGQLEVDLGGERSYMRQIEMVYRARPDFRGEAIVRVFGLPARPMAPPPPPPVAGGNWTQLGCQQVNLMGADRDSIRVGMREGRFRAIRLFVRGADVEMLDLKVVYSNGQPDDIPVKRVIRAGERTQPLDLQGWERAIQQIDMVYRTVINPANIIAQQRLTMATVCVEGLR